MTQFKRRKGGCLFKLIKLFLALFVIVAIALYFFTSQIVSKAISGVGSLVGVEMRGNANLVWGECAFSLKDFHIANPEGFLKGDAIKFDEVYIKPALTLEAIKGNEPIVIDEIRIICPFLRFEQEGITKNNLNEIIETGVTINAIISKPLIENIFFKNSP